MALFGKSSRGAHAAGSRSSKSRGQAARMPQADEQAAANDAYRTRQIDARLPRIDAESNVDVRRNVAGATGRQRPAQTGQASPLSTSSMPAATEAVGSYADLALDENAKQNLGPVVISLRNVTKVYPAQPNRPALANITLDIRSGEFLFLVGHSGSGKSTLLRCVNKLIDCTEGEILFEGRDIARARGRELRHARRRIAMIFQHYNLVYRATAIENVLQGRLGYKSAVAGMLGRYSEDEKRFVEKVLSIIPKDSLVINQPCDGSVFAYGVNGLNTYFRSTSSDDLPEDAFNIQKGLAQIAGNSAVQDAVERSGAKYVLLLDQGVPFEEGTWLVQTNDRQFHYWDGINNITDDTPVLEPVLAEGDMRLYKIVE